MYFKSIGLISFLLLGLCAALSDLDLFKKFKRDYKKRYATKQEEQSRYKIFQTNWHKAQEHNKKYTAGKVSWREGINEFTDLTDTEFATQYLVPYVDDDEFSLRNFLTSPRPRIHQINSANIPSSIDWRNHGLVTGVKHQRSCQSCWAFSTIGAIEGAYAKSHPRMPIKTFSEQALVDCERVRSIGCHGGSRLFSFAYTVVRGVVHQKSYPYKAVQAPTCGQKGSDFKISNFTMIMPNDENALKHAVGTVGPVSVVMNFSVLRSYTNGIFLNNLCSRNNLTPSAHAVLIVGYGNENGKNYWIIKNSYGIKWGESGYLRLEMGHNLCGIARKAFYPNLN